MNNSLCLLILAGFAFLAASAMAGNSSGTCPAPTPAYEQNPSAYPTYAMGRYQFIRCYYCLLRFLADCYFALVDSMFGLYNAFQPANTVPWTNASQLLFLPAHKAAKMIRNLELSATSLVTAYVNRIQQVDPLLNAFHSYNFNEALQLAAQYDAQLAGMTSAQRNSLQTSQPLYGVPFTVKANLNVLGKVTSACNIYLMNGTAATQDATIVARTKAAGGIILGITTMPNQGLSWAGDDTGCLPGNTVNNPHDTRYIPGGSSSGEAAIISAAGSPFGYGNDIGGSVRQPAHMCGIFGLKPTNFPGHAIPVDGIVPDFVSYQPAADQLSNGPLVRYASDLPLVMSVLTNTNVSNYNLQVDFANNFKLYYYEDMDILIGESLQKDQRDSVRMVKNYFEQTYNLTVQKVSFPIINRLYELWGLTGWSGTTISTYDAMSLLPEVATGLSNHTYLDLEFYMLKDFTLPKNQLESAFVADKLAKARQQVNELLGQNGLLLTPAWPTKQPYHHMEPFTTFNLYYTQTFNMLGNPALTVPVGKNPENNLPLGIQLAASPYNEALLIAAGRELEKAFGGWVQPGL